jgi:hypothetical protein
MATGLAGGSTGSAGHRGVKVQSMVMLETPLYLIWAIKPTLEQSSNGRQTR